VSFRSLLEAIGKIRLLLRKREIACNGIVFIRHDIYELLVEGSADRGKVAHVIIDWSDPNLLRELLRRRIRIETDSEDARFEGLWSAICVSHIRGEESSQYLINRSLMRPRCLIDLMQECRSHALNLGRTRIEEDDVRFGEQRYSAELTSNIGFEIADVFPPAGDILYHMIGRRHLIDQNDVMGACGISVGDFARVVDLLLWYGVLGFQRPDGDPAYIYTVNYDLRRLKAIGSQLSAATATYVINEAFHAGLEVSG